MLYIVHVIVICIVSGAQLFANRFPGGQGEKLVTDPRMFNGGGGAILGISAGHFTLQKLKLAYE